MKRALAERAKQSLPQTIRPPEQPSVVGSSTSSADQISPSTVTDPVGKATSSDIESRLSYPSQKIPRLDRGIKPEQRVLSDGVAESRATDSDPKSAVQPPSPRNNKKTGLDHAHYAPGRRQSLDVSSSSQPGRRARSSKANHDDNSGDIREDEEETDNTSAFYLKHQNRALATELKSLQHAVTNLSEERDARRQQCYKSIQALHSLQATWTAMETALQYHQPQGATPISHFPDNSSDTIDSNRIPPSTGTDDDVEWTLALQTALEALGKSGSKSRSSASKDVNTLPLKIQRKRKLQHQEEDEDDTSINEEESLEKSGVSEIQIATNIAARACVLQEWIWMLLSSRSNGVVQDSSERIAEQEKTIALLEAQKQTLETHITELAASRRGTKARERRLRRNVYRLAAGMLTSEQVVKALESDEGIAAEVEQEKQQKIKMEQLQQQNESLSNSLTARGGSSSHSGLTSKGEGDNDDSYARISQSQVDTLKHRVADLEDEVSTLKSALSDLNGILKEKEDLITRLAIKQLSDEDAQRLQLLDSTTAKLDQASKNVEELQEKVAETRNKWAQTLGNEKSALASIDEMIQKFNKRWSDFTGSGINKDHSAEENQEGVNLDSRIVEQSKQIIELQHKLDQALENVRQAESTRASLKEALILNGSLQSKLDEIKAKYAAVQAARNSATNVAKVPGQAPSHPADLFLLTATKERANDAASAASTPRDKEASASNTFSADKDVGNSGSNSKNDKLQRAYQRLRKDLANMTTSKEAAKAKLERAEKERETLVESNARLLKQISEKDEVNAKSLSTILYLKSQTDILATEKNNLEQQAKSSGQLVLAARLATNAKERVAEEVMKEKRALEEKVEYFEKEQAKARLELDRMSLDLTQMKVKMATENSELRNALRRIEQLTAENEEQRERALDLETAYAKAKREAREAKNKLLTEVKKNNVYNNESAVPVTSSTTSSSARVTGTFTVEQLNTQISVLKSRLACPVCHERDKQCIIMRCRHMHCQQCVDEQISNRSRKCPTCNNKFAEKDVEDIWLNT